MTNSSGDLVARIIFKLPPFLRVFIVTTGAVLVHLTLGTYHTFGNMLPYMASYLRNYTDPEVRIEQMIWIPTFQGCFPFAMVIGGTLSIMLGPRFAALVGCSITTLGVACSCYTIKMSLLLFMLTYGVMFGLGQGIAYVVAVTCVINWAPDRVGLMSGIVAAGFGVSSSIFAPIQTALVNPWNYPATDDGYFLQEELLKRVPEVFLTLATVYTVMQAVGLLVICDPPEVGSARRRSSSYGDEGGLISSDTDDDETNHREPLKPQARSLTPKEMLHSTTFYFLFVALFCCSFYANMFYNLYKTYAETFIKDDFFLALCFSVGSVANAMARIGWGYLTDKTSFQLTLTLACCSATILLLTMPLTQLLGQYVFMFWLTLLFICMAATHALFITATVKCFGTAYKATNYGCLILSTTLSGIALSFASEFALEIIGYSWMFLITAIFPFIAFCLTSMIHVTPQGHYIC